MRVTSNHEHKLPHTNMRKLRLSCQKKVNLKRWKVPEGSKRIYRLEQLWYGVKQQKENQLVITEKNNDRI